MSALLPGKVPERVVLSGRYARLEPIGPRHVDDLFRAATEPGSEGRFAYLPTVAPERRDEVEAFVTAAMTAADPLVFAVVDLQTGRAEGRQQLMRIDAPNGVIEVGGIYWGPQMARTRVATEALFLHARYVFETLGYRRFEWKCNDRNEPSKRAALRFGFTYEGLFRQHMIVKGENRDTAWFAILDGEWPRIRAEFERWLDPANFDASGRQLTPLRVAAA